MLYIFDEISDHKYKGRNSSNLRKPPPDIHQSAKRILNDGADLMTFAGAEILFDRPKIKSDSFDKLNNAG